MLLCFFIYYSFQFIKNIQTHQSPATELFEVLVWPIIMTTIDFLLKTCASEYMQITVPFCPQLQPDSLFFTWWIATLAIRNIIGVGITCPVILITGRGSLCPFSYTCIFVRPDGQPCVEAQEFGLVRNMLIAAVEERYKDAGNDPFVLCIHSVHRGLHIECLTMIPPSVVLSKLSECWTNITSLLLCNHVLQRNKTHWSWRNTLILKSNYH